MYLGTSMLADKKLIILYLLGNINIPLTKTQITNAVLENNLIDFFTLQQCISELESTEVVRQVDYQKRKCYEITDTGRKTVEVFLQRIPKSSMEIMDQYILRNKESLKKESQVISEYRKIAENEYIVNLKVIENELVLIDLKLSVVSSKQAKHICEKWKNSSEKIYSQLMSNLIN